MTAIRTAYVFSPERSHWVGAVYQGRTFFGPEKILTVGCMPTEQGIKLWLARVVRTRAWETASEPPDMYG